MSRPKGPERIKTSLRLLPEHHERLNAIAVHDRKTVTEEMDRALSEYLATRRIRKKKI